MKFDFFKAAAEDCGFAVGEPTTQGNETTVSLFQKTPEGKEWWLNLTYTDPADLADTILEMVDTFDTSDTEDFYNEETGEYETFDSLVDDERWKEEILQRLYDSLI